MGEPLRIEQPLELGFEPQPVPMPCRRVDEEGIALGG
jgi:hypothetical protein